MKLDTAVDGNRGWMRNLVIGNRRRASEWLTAPSRPTDSHPVCMTFVRAPVTGTIKAPSFLSARVSLSSPGKPGIL
jgi:hypothetical protein